MAQRRGLVMDNAASVPSVCLLLATCATRLPRGGTVVSGRCRATTEAERHTHRAHRAYPRWPWSCSHALPLTPRDA